MTDSRSAPARPPGVPTASSPVWLWVGASVWLVGAIVGLWALWAYENQPGVAAEAPQRWPVQSVLARPLDRPTLVVLAHPRCDCTRASLAELAEVLARATTPPKAYVLFMRPEGVADTWAYTDLWKIATGLPNVTVVRDEDGSEARRFGAATSGQALLYDANGALVFSGGLTGSRGHEGENAGRTALIGWLNHGAADRDGTSVFGCPLFKSGI